MEPNISYVSEITFTTDKENNCKWVGIYITNTAKTANISLPSIHKPRLIEKILNNTHGKDSELEVKTTAHYFDNKEINLAKKLIDGDTKNHLPIVYVSIHNSGKHILDIDSLAKGLSGIAHVIVEPNRKFSRDLSNLTNNKNAFSGYVGVYWPKGEGRNIIFREIYKKNIESKIKKIVIQAVSDRRQLEKCSWNYVAQQYSLYNINRINEYDELLGTASDEMKTLEEQCAELRNMLKIKENKLIDAEQEIKRLTKNLYDSNRNVDNSRVAQNSISFNCDERDIYPNEIKDIILKIINQARDSCDDDKFTSLRKLHILDSILDSNQITNHGKDIKNELKKILKGSSIKKINRELKKLGFEVEEGNHYNLYFGDKRYLFPLARSSSDDRASDNWISDFAKKMGIS